MIDPYEAPRLEMIESQIEQRGLHDPRLLAAFRSVPRHYFTPTEFAGQAYDDKPLPIGGGQTISQPYIVAVMTDLLQLQGDETVLEIGTGSGYQAAILATLVRTVHSIERDAWLAEKSRRLLPSIGYPNVFVHESDGCLGWPEQAPYPAILVTAAAPAPPPALLEQLSNGGRLVIPVGGHKGQILQVWQRQGPDFMAEDILKVSFVPLRGSCGWSELDWALKGE